MLWDASVGAAVSVLNRIPRSLCPVYLVGPSPMPPHARVLIQLSQFSQGECEADGWVCCLGRASSRGGRGGMSSGLRDAVPVHDE